MFQSLADQRITMADVMSSKHSVVALTDENILDITNKTVKIEQEKIINVGWLWTSRRCSRRCTT